MPVTVNGQPWGFQYSPYVYYNEHAIVMNTQHTPMVIDRSAFDTEVKKAVFDAKAAGITNISLDVMLIYDLKK